MMLADIQESKTFKAAESSAEPLTTCSLSKFLKILVSGIKLQIRFSLVVSSSDSFSMFMNSLLSSADTRRESVASCPCFRVDVFTYHCCRGAGNFASDHQLSVF